MEVQAPIALESRILSTDAIYVADKFPQTVRSFKIPLPDLILLRMQILFASRFTRNVLTEFESRTVNPITGSQRRRQDEPGHECRASSMLQLLRQNVRRIGPEVGSKKFAYLRLRQFREVLREFRFSITPREIIVRLGKPQFRQAPHHLRSRERLCEEDDVRTGLLHLSNDPFPKGKRLRMWIIHAEDPYLLLDPVHDDTLQFMPQFSPLARLKLQRENILIFFRRVLGILHRPVRPDTEPFAVLFHVGVIRRALKSNIDGDLDPIGSCLLHESPKVLQGSQLMLDRFMSSLQSADRPRAARISGAAGGSIVLSLPVGLSDGMNRRKIQDIEAHRGNVGEARLTVFERTVLARLETP